MNKTRLKLREVRRHLEVLAFLVFVNFLLRDFIVLVLLLLFLTFAFRFMGSPPKK